MKAPRTMALFRGFKSKRVRTSGATINLVHDRADRGRKIAMPVQVLWGGQGVIQRMFHPLRDWREVAKVVRGVPGVHEVFALEKGL